MRISIVAALLAVGSHTNAQSWSITAYAPFVGSATASAAISMPFTPVNNSATLPVGPAALPGGLATGASYQQASGSVNMSWGPSVTGSSAPLAFTADSSCACQGGYNHMAAAGGSARIDLTLRAPQPVGGRLFVRVFGNDTAQGSSRIDLDVNANGTIEVSAQTGAASTPLDVPLQIPATGVVIRLTYNLSTTANPGSPPASATRRIEAQFFPGEPAITPFVSGFATMSVDTAPPAW